MLYKLGFRPLATLETVEAYQYYESQKEGLGEEFLEEPDKLYDKLSANPFTHSYVEGSVRQGALKRFPYVVTYEVLDNVVNIYNVFMTAQDPDKKRLF